MDIHKLAISYYDIKTRKDEKRRVIDYEHSKKLKVLKSQAFNVENRLTLSAFEEEIRIEEGLFNQYVEELKTIEAELKPLLIKVNANTNDRLTTHIEGQVFLDTYINEDGKIVSGTYSKM